jgi:DNA (cytosine-5)-methyltransferase 1
MRYLSVCAGIEAATQGWHHLGWEPVAFSEIEPFPSAVLKHHYPNVPNWGDMTQFKTWPDATIDILVGGTPCQSFSVAGLRKGLEDPRGNLMLTFLGIADRYRPRYIVWENVPGVLSSNAGRDFGSFLGALGELGYGWAYRVLDAQWFGVAQRRRRVFVVGCLGDQRSAAAVLFERESVQRNPAPSREARQGAAAGFVGSVAGSLDTECGGGKLTHQSVANGHLIGTITARMFNALGARDVEEGALLPVAQPVAFRDTADYLTAAYGTKWNGNASADNGSLFAAQPVGFDVYNQQETGEVSKVVASRSDADTASIVFQPVTTSNDQVLAFDTTQLTSPSNYSSPKPGDPCHPLAAGAHIPAVSTSMQVRRLTPVECERLQGFPDNFTRIPWKKKPAEDCPDGPRYKALGNSMAVPCMKWIGERIGRQAC